VDLHAHSRLSDGTQTPRELMLDAAESGIGTIALTDHDSTAGWGSAFDAARGTGITVVPGMELSTQLDFASVHILGYLVDPADPALVAATDRIRDERLHRAEAMVARIAADYALDWEDVLAQATPGATLGRPHIADALVARGHVPDRSAAFRSILHWQGGYYRPHDAPPPIEGVRLITEAGGVAVIAHPGGRGPDRLLTDRRVRKLVDAGLFGLEVDHRDNPPASHQRWVDLASRFDLVMTGASDYHGAGKPNRLGENTTSPEAYAAILARGTGSAPVEG
jgi:predicted metal-dependent phosphoesterase TrpH